MLVSHPCLGGSADSAATRRRTCRSARGHPISRARTVSTFVVGLMIWAILLYLSRPPIRHFDHWNQCIERGGAVTNCVESAPRRAS